MSQLSDMIEALFHQGQFDAPDQELVVVSQSCSVETREPGDMDLQPFTEEVAPRQPRPLLSSAAPPSLPEAGHFSTSNADGGQREARGATQENMDPVHKRRLRLAARLRPQSQALKDSNKKLTANKADQGCCVHPGPQTTGLSLRKERHNKKERQRRVIIRSCCDKLNLLVPFCTKFSDKATTLKWTTAYLEHLQDTYGDALRKEFETIFDESVDPTERSTLWTVVVLLEALVRILSCCGATAMKEQLSCLNKLTGSLLTWRAANETGDGALLCLWFACRGSSVVTHHSLYTQLLRMLEEVGDQFGAMKVKVIKNLC
ncbi:uncharacterized protein LOC128750044 isoform X3 [Synchiropus splendidus]|uniref:uncharacterized protein LOC128750044 isoform X3 n=1 Tax=Synchiropus splendidus TaxID=270530 RepID=UPI00237EAE02|nr:uncharacterized protein LOC128750044 isoform X3 [Synchiropus splendidus]XP_053706156.1 uncharacterized protein LOC128750044 isoform X3 [Synchiropus splendidus]